MTRFTVHPGFALLKDPRSADPIQLAWMVNQIDSYSRNADNPVRPHPARPGSEGDFQPRADVRGQYFPLYNRFAVEIVCMATGAALRLPPAVEYNLYRGCNS